MFWADRIDGMSGLGSWHIPNLLMFDKFFDCNSKWKDFFIDALLPHLKGEFRGFLLKTCVLLGNLLATFLC